MKNLIKYYFGLNIDNLRLIGKDYYFLNNGIQYIFSYVDINKYDINTIFRFNNVLLNYNTYFHQIILNRDNQSTTIVGNNHYILLKVNITKNKQIDINDIIDCMIPLQIEKTLLSKINRFDWINLWKNKIDYFEYYTNSTDYENPYLNELINYYIGLGENAISYIGDTLESFKIPDTSLVVSHRRVDYNYTLLDLYNPLNITIDHRTRDISEYFKGLFINKKYNYTDINKYFDQLDFSEEEYRLFFGRLLFPSFFFDNYELYIEKKIKEKELLSLVNRINEYEQFLKSIFILINKRYYIPQINWLKKVDI